MHLGLLGSHQCIGILWRGHSLRVGMSEVVAKMPCPKKLLTQADFKECKHKLAEAANNAGLGARSAQHEWASCAASIRVTLHFSQMSNAVKSVKFFLTSDRTFSRLVCFFVFFFVFFPPGT